MKLNRACYLFEQILHFQESAKDTTKDTKCVVSIQCTEKPPSDVGEGRRMRPPGGAVRRQRHVSSDTRMASSNGSSAEDVDRLPTLLLRSRPVALVTRTAARVVVADVVP